MKKPVVDYREFRLSRLNQPRFSHLKLLAGWLFYIAAYILTENLIPAAACRTVHCALDDLIPFCEIFVIPYVFWYGWIVWALVYFALYHIESFKNLQKYIIVTQIVAVAVYVLIPNRQDLRPGAFPRDNVFSAAVALIYAVDTNTGVCPSLHCAYSIAIASAWMRTRAAGRAAKAAAVVSAGLICASTVLIKQHSVLDFFAAAAVCVLAEALVYGRADRVGKKRRTVFGYVCALRDKIKQQRSRRALPRKKTAAAPAARRQRRFVMHDIFRFKKEQIFTIPNLLSAVRLGLIPLIIRLYCVRKNYPVAALVIVVSGVTDILDGMIARKWHMVSDFGKLLDPLADKLTQLGVLICLLRRYPLMYALAALFAVKELTVAAVGYFLVRKENAIGGAQWYGKVNTAVFYGVSVLLVLIPDMPQLAAILLIGGSGAVMLGAFVMYLGAFVPRLLEKKKQA